MKIFIFIFLFPIMLFSFEKEYDKTILGNINFTDNYGNTMKYNSSIHCYWSIHDEQGYYSLNIKNTVEDIYFLLPIVDLYRIQKKESFESSMKVFTNKMRENLFLTYKTSIKIEDEKVRIFIFGKPESSIHIEDEENIGMLVITIQKKEL